MDTFCRDDLEVGLRTPKILTAISDTAKANQQQPAEINQNSGQEKCIYNEVFTLFSEFSPNWLTPSLNAVNLVMCSQSKVKPLLPNPPQVQIKISGPRGQWLILILFYSISRRDR